MENYSSAVSYLQFFTTMDMKTHNSLVVLA